MSFDSLTTKRILRKLGGDKITGKVFTYDGGEDAEFFDIAGLRVTLLSDDVFDLSKIKRIKCIFELYGQEFEFAEGDFELTDFNGCKAVQVSLGNNSAPVVIAHESGGLFGYAQEGFGYLSYVEFAETVHPIDPKYLPDTVATKADIFGAMEASY